MDMRTATGKQHNIIGCSILSERTLKDIEFDPKQPQFLEWLAKEKTFIESDSVGISKPTTIGYLTCLHLQLTNCINLKHLLQNTLEDIVLDLDLVVKLDPSLKMKQAVLMTNGDVFTPETHSFEVYTTKISHGHGKKEKNLREWCNMYDLGYMYLSCASQSRETFHTTPSPSSYHRPRPTTRHP